MKRGFMLMEVVVAVGILVVGIAFVGMQVQNSSRSARRAERSMRALLLAETTFTEFDAGLIMPEEEIEEEYGPLFPDYAWRMRIEPHTDMADLNQVTLEVLHQVRHSIDEEFDFDEAEVVHRVYTLRATPMNLDLTRDFGMDEEDADRLAEQLSAVTENGIDPRDLDPALFAALDLEELLEVAPPLLEAFGLSVDDLMQVLPEELRQALAEAQAQFEGSEGADESAAEGDKVSGGSRRPPRGRRGGRDAGAAGDDEVSGGSRRPPRGRRGGRDDGAVDRDRGSERKPGRSRRPPRGPMEDSASNDDDSARIR